MSQASSNAARMGCAFALVAGASCGPALPIQYETEHLRIGTALDHPLCEGDLVALERVISTVEDELSVEMQGVTTVYVWDDEQWFLGPNENCPKRTLGCINYSSSTIWTSVGSLQHELVHAVIGGVPLAPFFEEAIADIYGGWQTRFGPSAPSTNDGRSIWTIDRQTGRHFVRWLRERWDSQALGELVRARGRSFKAFEAVYGVSVAQAEARYFDEAPYGYPSMYGCDGPRLAADELGWSGEVELDCGAGEDTRVAGIGMSTHRTFVVTEPGYYTFSLDADWFDIFRCSGATVEEAPDPHEIWEDAPVHHSGYPSGASWPYFGRGVRDLYLQAGTHDINLGLYGHGAGFARVAIWPSVGPQPAAPE